MKKNLILYLKSHAIESLATKRRFLPLFKIKKDDGGLKIARVDNEDCCKYLRCHAMNSKRESLCCRDKNELRVELLKVVIPSYYLK